MPTGIPDSIISRAPTTLARAAPAPTERSNPPEMIANVMAQAMMPMTEFCCSTLLRLAMVRNCGEVRNSVASRNAKTTAMP
ncbi:hypothetical protein D3C83_130200 [compost metagenome]